MNRVKSEEIKENQEKIIENIIKNNIYRECITNKNYHQDKNNNKYYDEYISLKKLYEELYKETIFFKEQYTTLKDKQKMIYNKFQGIINLYNGALNLILQEEDLQINNISINKEIIEKGNYENLTSWQKYVIVMLLIKHLLPLLETSIDENDIVNINKSKVKMISTNFNSDKNILSNLTQNNFRSMFDKKIDICDSNIIDFTSRSKNNSRSLKSFNSEPNLKGISNKKIKEMIKKNSFNENKSMRIFKAIKGKYRPLRFIHIENKFNFNIKSEKDISFKKNNFFE